jgi:hypothetical protein
VILREDGLIEVVLLLLLLLLGVRSHPCEVRLRVVPTVAAPHCLGGRLLLLVSHALNRVLLLMLSLMILILERVVTVLGLKLILMEQLLLKLLRRWWRVLELLLKELLTHSVGEIVETL